MKVQFTYLKWRNPRGLSYWVWVLLTFASGVSSSARADILFLDLNAALPEIKAAQRAADERGEKLWVLPDVALRHREEIATLDRKAHSLEKSIKPLTEQLNKSKHPHQKDSLKTRIQKLKEQLSQVRRKVEVLTQPHRVTFEQLKQSIQSIQDQGHRIESVVFSGHSNGRDFSGSFGGLNGSEVQTLIANDPRLQESVKGVYLWGCYTGTKAATLEWKGKLQNVDVVMGFHKQAPTDLTQASPSLLESSLKKQEQFSRSESIDSAKKMLQSIEHASGFPIAGLIHDCYVGTKVASVQFTEGDVQCAAADQRVLNNYIRVFYVSLMGESPNGELDTGPTSALRRFYADYQAAQHCPQTRALKVSAQKIVSLLHYKEVAANAVELYSKELMQLRDQIRMNPEPKYQDAATFLDQLIAGKITRRDTFWLDWNLSRIASEEDTKIRARAKFLELNSLLGGADSEMVRPYLDQGGLATIDRFRKHVYELDCVPLSWVAAPIPGVTPEKPTCEGSGR